MNKSLSIFLSYAFRPLFLLAGAFAVGVVPLWVATLHAAGPLFITPMWHSHEMLVGFALAAVAGFSLTAVANWTGRPAIHGLPVALLVLSWLAGRLAMLMLASLPASLVMLLDMLFPLLLCLYLGNEIVAAHNRRNYPLVAIAGALAVFNGLYHLGVMNVIAGAGRVAIFLMIHTIVVLVTIISGRIVPAFTANWLRAQGQQRLPVNQLTINRITLWLTIVTGLAASLMPAEAITGVLAFVTAAFHAFRLSRWRGFATTANPVLFVLHAAYAWLPVAYGLMGCAVFGWGFTPTAALHALTMGAIGSMVIAVGTRVALGHTGRPLQVARAIVFAYWVYMLAVLIRILGPFAASHYLLMIDLSAAGWVVTFVIFLIVYAPILIRKRPDT